MWSVISSSLGVVAFAALTLAGCEFSDVVDIGRDQPGGTAGAPMGMGTAGLGGASGTGGIGVAVGGRAPVDVCGIGVQNGQIWVEATAAGQNLTPGTGGPLQFGEYRLTGLAKRIESSCFAERGIAQTLSFRDGGRGSIISDYAGGGHFAAAFTFAVGLNSIQITPTCSYPNGPMSEQGSFGPFETYTATSDALWLVSQACNYVAAYEFMPVPTR